MVILPNLFKYLPSLFNTFNCLDAFLQMFEIWELNLSSKSIVTPSNFTSFSHLILFPAKSRTIFLSIDFLPIAMPPHFLAHCYATDRYGIDSIVSAQVNSVTAIIMFTPYKFDGAPATLTRQSRDLVQCHFNSLSSTPVNKTKISLRPNLNRFIFAILSLRFMPVALSPPWTKYKDKNTSVQPFYSLYISNLMNIIFVFLN